MRPSSLRLAFVVLAVTACGVVPVAADPPVVVPPARPPRRRRASAPAMAFDGARGEVVLFGGQTVNAFFADTWAWNGRVWRQLRPRHAPSPRSSAEMAYTGSTPKTRPAPSQAWLSVDPVRGVLVAMADDVAATPVQQWEFDGRSWSSAFVITPPRRDPVQTVTDERDRTIVLFGGLGKNDTWTWDGITWIEQAPLQSPPVRSTTGLMPGMAYDAARGRVVLFGGAGDEPVLNDTWLWDGVGWTRAA
ncbi:MAG: hypothetical protein E6J41_31205 [Chloroflexi bacterium]|nr:MAG: hypothetical protein E6J41_31205 [Chloroflexota bacterium]